MLENDILKYVASKYPVSNYRTLVGHSFGGIFALNILAKHKNLFDNYIVIDPSTWYDDRKFSKQVLDSLSKNNYAGKSLFVGIANTTEIEDTVEVKKQKSFYSEHERSILAFCTGVRTIKNNGYKQRKGTENFFTSPRLYNTNQTIEFLGNKTIQTIDSSDINKYNTGTFVHIE